ncbi:DUF4386 domain-containing protein [Cohnella hashimotonis]|uniref:DUF4386 domain-containing protein n=1 Tax=Cohnella hashimotonis TaxID=2826895 RepID=A0ABT6TCP4_9BACL|nr:DUF4386 domain-containing protein [Cohnella hashimotonis]MDI4643602.1 DUF4386 domain-containing protein [Cohnella hashimotonis]
MNGLAKAAGALFLVSTAAYMIGSGLLNPVLQGSEVLGRIDGARTSVIAGTLLELVNAAAVAGIAMLLYPILKKRHEAFALGYFGSRIIESAILIVSLIVPVVFLMFGEKDAATAAADRSVYQAIADWAVEAHYMLFELAMIVLGLGSLPFCYILYRFRLVPRFLPVFGFVGYAGLLTSSCLALAGRDMGTALYIPGAIFEIGLPLWLIFKGVNPRTEG